MRSLEWAPASTQTQCLDADCRRRITKQLIERRQWQGPSLREFQIGRVVQREPESVGQMQRLIPGSAVGVGRR